MVRGESIFRRGPKLLNIMRLLSLLLLALTFSACESKEVKEEIIIEKEMDADARPGMMHTVYFWLKPDLSEEDHEDFLKGLRSLETIESVKNFYIGPPAGTESRDVVDNSFDYALITWFDDVAGHDAYQVDPIHLKFVEESGERFEKVVVRDNELMD